MKRRRSNYDWQRFNFAINQRSLYILGAGASLPDIPSQIGNAIRRRIWGNGIFEASAQPTFPLRERIFPFDEGLEVDAFYSGSISKNELIAHVRQSVIETLVAQAITIPDARRAPQYEVFNRFYPSILFNFNNDNLANSVDDRHLVLRPHGAVNAELVHSSVVKRAVEWSTVPENFHSKSMYHRMIPEPWDITSRTAYRMLISRFNSVRSVVIIGYSFGEQVTTGLIDDAEFFEMLVDLLRWRPKPILLVNPDPERLFFRIEESIHCKSVSAMHCKWNVLAEFILSGGYKLALQNSWQEVTSLYLRFEDAMSREQTTKPSRRLSTVARGVRRSTS
jgi:hypothetical protein